MIIKKTFYTIVSLIVVLFLAAGLGSRIIDDNINPVLELPPPTVSERALGLHNELLIVDWHADTLLWNRNILKRAKRGHVDLPRLQEGNTGLQMFTVVSKSPYGQNDIETSDTFDKVTPLVMIQGWPIRTWNSLLERALHQAAKLQMAADSSGGELVWIKSREDLTRFLAERQQTSPPVTGAMFGSEGAHVLEGNLANLDRLYDVGLRMMALQHFFDNKAGGSLHGMGKGGLTEFGRELVAALNKKQIMIDLAHSSQKVVEDVLAISKRPVVISHTGIYGACNSPRNLPDSVLKAVADKGGLIAVGYWGSAICDVSPAGIAKSIRYAVDILGEDHVALGSDFDGAVATPFDAAGLPRLTLALLQSGLTEAQIRKVMGENSIRFLQQQLPTETP